MPLPTAEIYERLQTEDLALLFDTNILTQRGFMPLCQQVQRINLMRVKPYIKLHVPAIAHAEHLFHLAQQYGDNYNLEFIQENLVIHDIEILNFTQQQAEYCAKLLQQKYNTPTAWQAAKKRRCLECVGLPHDYLLATGTGSQCGAPNDWLIMAQAHNIGMILVTEDKGRHEEFSLVSNIARYDNLKEALNRVLTELIDAHQKVI
jgi:hypothetical protein